MADRNPWLPTPTKQAKDFAHFDPTTTRRAMKDGNTMLHKRSGQNVVFVDGHVSFEDSPLCGPDGDNIYSCWPAIPPDTDTISFPKENPRDTVIGYWGSQHGGTKRDGGMSKSKFDIYMGI